MVLMTTLSSTPRCIAAKSGLPEIGYAK